MLNRGYLIVLASILFLIGSIIFSNSAKKDYITQSQTIKQEVEEVLQTKDLQKLWRVTGIKTKLEKALANFKNKSLKIDRKKATLSANDLNYNELNKMLNKLASLPLQFRDLTINKIGEKFNLECVCVW